MIHSASVNFVMIVKAQMMLCTRDVPNEVATEDMVNKIHDIVLYDHRMKIHEIAKMGKHFR